MKQGNAAIRRKQVKQISVFRAWWPLREFSRYIFLEVWPFFGHKSFNSGAKGIHKWVQLELGKSKKGRPIVKLWSFYHYLGVELHDTPGLILFIGGHSRLNGVFCYPSRISLAYGNLSTANVCLNCYVI